MEKNTDKSFSNSISTCCWSGILGQARAGRVLCYLVYLSSPFYPEVYGRKLLLGSRKRAQSGAGLRGGLEFYTSVSLISHLPTLPSLFLFIWTLGYLLPPSGCPDRSMEQLLSLMSLIPDDSSLWQRCCSGGVGFTTWALWVPRDLWVSWAYGPQHLSFQWAFLL